MCIDIEKILVGIVTCHFSLICKRVMALDFLQNFVSAQYLENKSTDLSPNFVYDLILTRSRLGL